MIRIIKTSKRKNPHLEDIEEFIESNSSKFKYLNKGVEGKAFYFKLDKRLVLNTEILKPDEYVLKILSEGMEYYPNEIKKLKILSKYGLIPKIFVITKKYVIMKFIKGTNLYDLWKELKGDKKEVLTIRDKVEELYEIWRKLGFDDDIDPNDENIIVSEDLKHVYLIDPFIREEIAE